MKKLIQALGVFALLFAGSSGHTQVRQQSEQADVRPHCYFDELLQVRRDRDPGLQGKLDEMDLAVQNYLSGKGGGTALPKSGNLIIPVVVYIVHNNGAENITDTQVLSQMNALNDYYEDYGIQFCLATMNGSTPLPGTTTPGIIRIQNAALTNLDATSEHAALTATSSLSDDRYLRIWVVKSINGGAVAGYSILPDAVPSGEGGIAMDYKAFGEVSTCGCTVLAPGSQHGKILVHETGHFLGLYHTFNEGCAGMTSSDCALHGDRVCDTPPVASPNGGCSTNNSCSESPNLPDDIHNYMDYTDEGCLNHFTDGQNDRMHAMISLYYAQLVSGSNHTYTGINCNGGLLPAFTASSFAPCVGTSVTFTATPVTGATYEWDFGDGNTATGQVANHTYTSPLNPGSVTLTVTSGSSSASAIQTIVVENCQPINNSEAHWYFHDMNALDFSSGAPVYDNSAFVNGTFAFDAQNVNEASAVQSDDNGNLLFYTDGIHVWNSQHQLISSGLHGNHSSMNGAMIVPDPANSNQYYIFTTDVRSHTNPRGLNYTKVQVSGTTASMVPGQLNIPVTVPAGMGFETSANNALISAEGITSVEYPGGYYLIAGAVKNNIESYMVVFNVSSSGVAYHGQRLVGNLLAPLTTYSVLAANIQASPNAKYVAYSSATWNNDPDYVFDFDRCNGTFSNQRLIPVISGSSNFMIEFSPDSRFLYAAYNHNVFQYYVEPCEITGRLIATVPSHEVNVMQRGPNGKIYGTKYTTNELFVIHRPNELCTDAAPNACMFAETGPTMQNGTLVRSGLPNMIDAKLVNPFNHVILAEVSQCSQVCNTYDFEFDGCLSSYNWNFGDPASGSSNTSTAASPSHTFSGAGTYTVTITSGSYSQTLTVEIGASPEIAGSLTICPDNSMTGNYNADIPNGYSVNWSVSGGTIAGLNNQSSVLVNWTSLPGTVTLTLTDDETGCTFTRTVEVVEFCEIQLPCYCKLKPIFNWDVNQTNCNVSFEGQALSTTCTTILNYSWDFGDGTTGSGANITHSFPGPGTYTVCLNVSGTSNGALCQKSICKDIVVDCSAPCECELKPFFDVTIDGSKCSVHLEGDAQANDCMTNVTYEWHINDGSPLEYGQNIDHQFAASGTYEICLVVFGEANGEECVDYICKTVDINCTESCDCKDLKPQFDIKLDTKTCTYTFFGLSGLGEACEKNLAYDWDFGDGTTSIGKKVGHVFSNTGSYDVCLTVALMDDKGKILCKERFCRKVDVSCTGNCDCKLIPSFDVYNFGNCDFTFFGHSGSDCANIKAYQWYVNGSGPYDGQVLNQHFNVNTTYEVCLVVYGYTDQGECEEHYCKEFFYTDCYPAGKSLTEVPEGAVALYPNPAASEVTVKLNEVISDGDQVQVVLRAADGRLLATYDREPSAEITLAIPESVSEGFIFVEITTGGKRYVKKLMILRD